MQVKKKTLKNRIWRNRYIYLLLLPAVLYYLVFHYAPMGGIIVAFQRFSVTKGFFGSKWVGLRQFEKFFSDPFFWRILRNTLTINLKNLVIGFPIPIIFALLLNELKNEKFKKAVQTITYMPHFLSIVVVASMVLLFVSINGPINALIEAFGGEAIFFMNEEKYFQWIYVISEIWQQFGWSSILYISAIAGIDQEMYEAADIDGAGRFGKIRYITLPSITGTIMITLIMKIGQMLSVGSEKIILLYNPTLFETADVISSYVYRRGLIDGDYSYSAAVGLFNSVFNLIFLISANKISKKATGAGLW